MSILLQQLIAYLSHDVQDRVTEIRLANSSSSHSSVLSALLSDMLYPFGEHA